MGTDTDDNNPLLSDERKRKYIRNLRYINIAVAIITVVLSIFSSVMVIIEAISTLKIFLILSPVYMTIFSVLLLAAQFKIRFVLKKMPFLRTALGKGLFYLYLSSVIFYYFYAIGDQVLGYVAAFCLLFSALMYLAIHFGCSRGISQQDLQGHYDQTYRQRLV